MQQKEAREYLWSIGMIGPWYLKDYQMAGYELMIRERFPFLEFSRRIGKTTTGLVRAQEKCRQKEGTIWRWCEPWKYQAREIVMPEMDRMQDSCPTKYKFKYYKTDSFYELPSNGSRMYLRGLNEDRGESARGSFADGITIDEKGSIKDLHYVQNEVLYPQLLSTNGQLVSLSTPPRDLGHLYYDEKARAMRENRFIQLPIWASLDQLYSKKQIEDMCAAVGGETTPGWRREFLCEPVSDPDALVIPEWSDEENILDDDHPRPDWFTPYVAGDSGIDDNTAILFGYYDFAKNEVVIEEELVINGRTTTEIVARAKEIEKALWKSEPHKRTYDADKQLVFDIFVDLKWRVQMPQKQDKTAAIHELRVEVGARRFKVKRRCTQTCRQMKVGMWKDEKHLDFQRSEGLGHLDAVAAAIYFNRSIDRKLNPMPQNYGYNRDTQILNPSRAVRPDKTEEALNAILGGRRRGFR